MNNIFLHFQNSPQEIKNFIAEEVTKAEKHRIGFNLENAPQVKYAERLCSGFFEAEWPLGQLESGKTKSPHLATAIDKPQDKWLPILVHETSHMDQFIEKSPYWMSTENYSALDQWLEGADISEEKINTTINNIILLEADCEQRTINKIKKHDLPIDTGYYAQRANAYLMFHHYMLENRTWCKRPPYEVPEIIALMPTTMKSLDEYLVRPSDEVMEVMKKCMITSSKLTLK